MSGQISANKRVIIVGASNVTRGLRSLIVQTATQLGGSVEFLIAAGYGRSLGISSQVIIRRLPSIRECELWNELRKRPELPTFALVTDLGNDLPYEIPVPQILFWFEDLLRTLSEHQANIVYASLPIASIQRIQRWQFNVLRRVLFPGSNLRFEDAIQFAQELDEKSKKISNFFSVKLIEPSDHWYGFDPIHIKRRFLSEAWQTYTHHWLAEDQTLHPDTDNKSKIPMRRLRPFRRWIVNREQLHSQPCWHSPKVGSISLY